MPRRIARFFSLPLVDQRLDPALDPVRFKRVLGVSNPQSRWHTTEFRLYMVVFLIVVPLMFKQGLDISQPSHPNYSQYEPLLSPGWIFGRKVDNSDTQYRFFRDNFWLLVVLMLSHVMVKRVCCAWQWHITKLKFDLIFGVVFILFAHGMNAFKILFHVTVCYAVVKVLIAVDKEKSLTNNNEANTKVYKITAITFLWVYGIAALYFNDRYRDFQLYGSVFSSLQWLDDIKGIVPRWDVFYNFSLLRTISFNMDYIYRYYDLKNSSKGSGIQLRELELSKKKSDSISQEELNLLKDDEANNDNHNLTSDLTDRERQNYPWSLYDYTFAHYLAYVLYAPLFIAGPVLTFNDYLYQTRHTLSTISLKNTAKYALRFIFCILTMEFTLHFMYVVAIAKLKIYDNYTPFQISMIGLFNLNVIWLKLLIPWRFFRLWALIDNIDPPENMIRCMNNNYSALAFWRAWHRSFNKWVTRYVYVPLGGSKHRILSSLAVFSFVAVWHDIEFKLLIWGWLIVIFLLPEIFLSQYFAKHFVTKPWYRFICGMGSVLNIWLMMIANIYGFCLGHDGTVNLLKSMLFTVHGGVFFITCSACLFVAVQVMYELRESEKRRGIDVRC